MRGQGKNALLALVLIPPRQLVTLDQILQRIIDAIRAVQVERKIEHVVVRIRVVTALGGDAGAETAAEELVEGGVGGDRGGELAVESSGRRREGVSESGGRREGKRREGRGNGGKRGETHPFPYSAPACIASIANLKNSCESSCLPNRKCFAIAARPIDHTSAPSLLLFSGEGEGAEKIGERTLEVLGNESRAVRPLLGAERLLDAPFHGADHAEAFLSVHVACEREEEQVSIAQEKGREGRKGTRNRQKGEGKGNESRGKVNAQPIGCAVLSNHLTNGGVCNKHCNAELRKHVLPWFCKPAPTGREEGQETEVSMGGKTRAAAEVEEEEEGGGREEEASGESSVEEEEEEEEVGEEGATVEGPRKTPGGTCEREGEDEHRVLVRKCEFLLRKRASRSRKWAFLLRPAPVSALSAHLVPLFPRRYFDCPSTIVHSAFGPVKSSFPAVFRVFVRLPRLVPPLASTQLLPTS